MSRRAPYVAAAAVTLAAVVSFASLAAGGRDNANAAMVDRYGAALTSFSSAVPRAEVALRVLTGAPLATDHANLATGVQLLAEEEAVSAVAVVDAGPNVVLSRFGDDAVRWAKALREPAAVEAMAVARDLATVVASRPLSAGGGPLTLLVAPLYRVPATGTVDRRANIDSFVLAALDARRLAGAKLGSALGRSVRVAVSDGDTALLSSGLRPGDHSSALAAEIEVAKRRWLIAAAAPSQAPPPVAWLVLILGLASASVLVGSQVVSSRDDRATKRAAAARARQLELVVASGALLQESLDLADVLPSFATRLSDELDLAGLAVATVTREGQLVDVFAVGAAGGPSLRVADLRPPPLEVAAGQMLTVPLERDRRIIGALRILPRQGLDQPQVNAARAAAELLAAALGNAELYLLEQDSVRRLQEIDRLKTAFLGTISHELRTPLVAIRGFTDLLQSQWDQLDEPVRRDFVERIARNAHSLSNLVQDVLDFARLEREAVRVELGELNLSTEVRALVGQMSSLLGEHPVTLDIEPDVSAWSDVNAVERIVSNLLSNAVKFSPPQAPLAVRLHTDGDQVVVAVDDAGPGIAAAERERIFERFYRGDTSATIRTKGAGIGLTIVKELVDRVGAELDVGTSPLGGARFTVRFPAQPPHIRRADQEATL